MPTQRKSTIRGDKEVSGERRRSNGKEDCYERDQDVEGYRYVKCKISIVLDITTTHRK